MLIHPWDAAISDTEWRDWLAGHDFGQLAVNDPGNGAPLVGELLKSVNTGSSEPWAISRDPATRCGTALRGQPQDQAPAARALADQAVGSGTAVVVRTGDRVSTAVGVCEVPSRRPHMRSAG